MTNCLWKKSMSLVIMLTILVSTIFSGGLTGSVRAEDELTEEIESSIYKEETAVTEQNSKEETSQVYDILAEESTGVSNMTEGEESTKAYVFSEPEENTEAVKVLETEESTEELKTAETEENTEEFKASAAEESTEKLKTAETEENTEEFKISAAEENTEAAGSLIMLQASSNIKPAATLNNKSIGEWDGDFWSYDFGKVSFGEEDIYNATSAVMPTDSLYLAPCILYDYKEGRPGKSNGSDYYRNERYYGNQRFGSWKLEWYNQFAYFDGLLTFEYYNKYNIPEKMYIGATDSLNRADSRPIKYLWQGGDITQNKVYMWAVNHNLGGSPVDYYIESLSRNSGMNGSTALAGLAGNRLDVNGNITVGSTGYVMPYFNNEFLSESYGGTGSLANIYGADKPKAFPFRKEGSYYVFDSTEGEDNVYYTGGKLRYSYNTNIVYDFDVPRANEISHDPGFFPFNDTNVGNFDNAMDVLNYGNGLRVDIPFTIQEDSGEDIIFNFSGDDDLWVYVDGHLVLDMGGAHSMSAGSINFTKKTVTVDSQAVYSNERLKGGRSVKAVDSELCSPNKVHTLSVFYMERGLYKSNLHIEFNFKPVELAEKYYAEIGTPIFIDIPDEVYDYVCKTGVSAIESEGKSKIELVNVNGKIKIKYTGLPENDSAFAERLRIGTDNAVVTITINNYKLNDDVYVIDYGLPVELRTGDKFDLFYNDSLVIGDGDNICELGLSEAENSFKGIESRYSGAGADLNIKENVHRSFGNAYVEDKAYQGNGYGSYKYKPEKFIDGADVFYYAVQVVKSGSSTQELNAKNATPVMTAGVTILPANSVYYEDDFSYNEETKNTSAIIYGGNYSVVNNTGLDIIQSNNQEDLYGYDIAYKESLSDGLDGAQKLSDGNMVQFDFTGTGFDVIARAADTAAVTYIVADKNNKVIRCGTVDTYYNNGTLYQLPIISVKDLERDTYTVKFIISATGKSDEGTAYSSFYFDGVRIYNPLDADNAEKYYLSSEYEAFVYSVHDMILGDGKVLEQSIVDDKGEVINTEAVNVPGSRAVLVSTENGSFVNGTAVVEDMSDIRAKTGANLVEMLHAGPNNEIYLDSSSAIAFYAERKASSEECTMQIEVKAVQTGTTQEKIEQAGLKLKVNGNNLADINTATSMYYNIPESAFVRLKDGRYLVLIQGDDSENSVLSFTNLKVKGYDISPVELENKNLCSGRVFVESAGIKGSDTNTVERKTEFIFTVRFNEEAGADVLSGNTESFKINGNGKTVTIRNIEYVGNGEYEIKTLAPNGVGNYKYDFIYENADETLTVTSIAVSVTAGAKGYR